MKARITFMLALGVLVGALFVIFPTGTARAMSDEVPRRMVNATPPVTLGDGQTFIPCIFDGDGSHLKMGEVVRLEPGALVSFDIGRAEAGHRTDPNVVLRAGVHINEENSRFLSVSGEVVDDSTNKSTILIGGLNAPPDRVSEEGIGGLRATRLLSPVGITYGQKLRVTFVNVGTNPFEIIPCVFDGDGAHLKTGDMLTILPGESRSLEMSRSEIVERTGPRLQIYSGVHVRRSDLRNLMLIGEVIDESTGRGSLFVPGLRVGFDPQPDPPAPN